MTRRATYVLALLLCPVAPVLAADSSATERLMRVADCIRDAGDMKGAAREAFMTECQAAKDRAAGEGVRQKSAPVAAPVVAPAAVQADGLPTQERILGCATASKGMQGKARSVYLKECLVGACKLPPLMRSQSSVAPPPPRNSRPHNGWPAASAVPTRRAPRSDRARA